MPTCIICWKETSAMSDEHVIPEALGGYYHIRCVCRDCNSRLGSHVDSMLVNHTFAKFGRYLENISGKSKKLPNPFSGTHALDDDETQKVRLDIDETGAFQPHLIPKVECTFDHSAQELKLDLAIPPSDKDRILDKVKKRYGVKVDRENLPIESKQVTVKSAMSIDTLRFKIGLLKIAYEFAYDRYPLYRSDPTVETISEILRECDYKKSEIFASIGSGFDREVLKPFGEIIDFQQQNHYLFLVPSNKGLVCFVHLYNMFSIGVSLSKNAYPDGMIIGVNNFRESEFVVYDVEEMANIVFGSPDIRLQYFFETEHDCAEFVQLQSGDQFAIFSEDGDYPLYDSSGNELEKTILTKVAELTDLRQVQMDCRILDVTMDEEVYVRVMPANSYIRVSVVRLEYPPRTRL